MYVLIIGTYIGISTSTIHHWRQTNIVHSPTVFITSTGEKYHRAYHYKGYNFAVSLFEADEKGYKPCKNCHPPIAPTYPNKPGFYFYNWVFISVGISLIYWIIIIRRLTSSIPNSTENNPNQTNGSTMKPMSKFREKLIQVRKMEVQKLVLQKKLLNNP